MDYQAINAMLAVRDRLADKGPRHPGMTQLPWILQTVNRELETHEADAHKALEAALQFEADAKMKADAAAAEAKEKAAAEKARIDEDAAKAKAKADEDAHAKVHGKHEADDEPRAKSARAK